MTITQTWAFALLASDLTSSERLTALVIGVHTNQSGTADIGHRRIAVEARQSPRTVGRNLDTLERKEWLTRSKGRGVRPSRFHIRTPNGTPLHLFEVLA